MRYDWLDGPWYQRALETLVAKGYRPYLVLSEVRGPGLPQEVQPAGHDLGTTVLAC